VTAKPTNAVENQDINARRATIAPGFFKKEERKS